MSEGNFEAKKHAYRQTQDGIVISFVLHPSDVSPALAAAALGTRYMVAFAEIAGDETLTPARESSRSQPAVPKLAAETEAGSQPAGGTRPKQRFEDMRPSQQAALRCNDPRFWAFLYSLGYLADSPDSAAECVRRECQVDSRRHFDASADARAKWDDLEVRYESWRVTSQYGDLVR